MHTKRLRKTVVSVDGKDANELKPRMIDNLRVSKPSLFHGLSTERESKREAEYVEDGSVAMRSGTVQHSREHPMFGLGFGPKETVYTSDLRRSETFSVPKRSLKYTNKLYKKAKQNSSELAEPRRLTKACFGLVRKQETESYRMQVVGSQPEVEERGAQAHKKGKAS